MIVICRKNKDANIAPLVLPFDCNQPLDENNFVCTVEESSGGLRVGYALTEQQSYVIYAILFYKQQIRFLVQNDNGIPMFFSSELFGIVDRSIFFDWEIRIVPIDKHNLTI